MFPRLRPALLITGTLFAAGAGAQTTPPSMPAATPQTTPYPSMPAPSTEIQPIPPPVQVPSTPATDIQPTPPAPPPPASTPETRIQAIPPASLPAAVPGSELSAPPNTLQKPQTTPSGAYIDPLEQPVAPGVNGTPSTLQPTYIAPPQNVPVASVPSIPAYYPETLVKNTPTDHLGSTYIPVDSFIYPMVLRLYSLGYLDTAFISMRPLTRRSLLHALQRSAPDIMGEGGEEAQGIYAALVHELQAEDPGPKLGRGSVYGVYDVYTRMMGIAGRPLRDSYHVGQTLVNDYGRPYAAGFNNVTGFSTVNEFGRFSLFVRGELQHAPAYQGYTFSQAQALSDIDQIPFTGHNNPQSTIPYNNTGSQNNFRLLEATLSFHLLGHEISGGKSDAWIGPGTGGAMAYSDNAEDIYSFRINRVEPMYIPLIRRVLGPLRYDFFVGSLKGHTYPNEPWVHSESFSFAPSSNFQFEFQRTIIWGGHGHGCYRANGVFDPTCNEPITLHTFFKSFFDINDTTDVEKYSRDDPGARFSQFSFSYRLPFLRKYVTLYTDSTTHDDVTPVSAPRRAGWRPGLYFSQLPFAPKLDLRVEGVYTDYVTLRSQLGQGNYYETVQRQGYTNKGFLFGDPIGREAKGGQAWLTYHLSPEQYVQFSWLNKENDKDFIPSGSTQNDFTLKAVKRFHHDDVELNAWVQVERWNAPFVTQTAGSSPQHDTSFAGQLTFFPKLHSKPTPTGR